MLSLVNFGKNGRMNKMKEFKVRCSGIGEIMGDVFKASLTDNQIEELKKLEEKEKPTAKQKEKIEYLIQKRDSKPELSKGARSHVESWLDEQIFGRYEQQTKETKKGNMVEVDALEYAFPGAGKYMGDRLEDDFFCGTPDCIYEDMIVDIKAPFSHKTHPHREEKIPTIDYIYQVQGYMELTGLKKAKVVYVLMTTPKELDKNALCYDFIDRKYRVKEFDFEYNPILIGKIKERVEMCREYLNEIL